MAKRVLSVILVLTVFFGGYAIIPKKANILPANEVYAVEYYRPGAYKVTCTFTASKWVDRVKKSRQVGFIIKHTEYYWEDVYEYKTYYQGDVVSLNQWGEDYDYYKLGSYIGSTLTPYIV